MLISYIEEKTERILRDAGFFRVPIKIDELIKSYGIILASIRMDDSISGLINIDEKGAKIAINADHSQKRQRFTKAHEFGHYTLHGKGNNLFINQSNRLLFRDEESSMGEKLKEKEANAFAAAILMPAALLRDAILESHYKGNALVQDLADKFEVSQQAMSIRLNNLGFMDYDYFWDTQH